MNETLISIFKTELNNDNTINNNLFTDLTNSKFIRKSKPEEFNIPIKPVVLIDNTVNETESNPINDEKKRKRYENRKRKQESSDNNKIENITNNTDNNDINNNDTDAKVVNELDETIKSDNDTIFVGNIPITETVKSLTKYFKTYGEIDSIRLRSVPVAGAKVDESGNQDLVRKVCINSKKFGEQKGSFNAYIKFKESNSVNLALQANNQLLGTRHLRVDRSNPTLFDTKRSIFLGNLPHYADEEEIREYFAKSLPNGHDDIEGMRIIRDSNTLIGKGIGYILLKDRDALLKALQLHQSVFKKRWTLRVSACGKRLKRNNNNNNKSDNKDNNDDNNNDTNMKKKQKSNSIININANSAMKRIKMKSTITKNKLLQKRNQKNNKKSKRLGGVIKKVIKANKK